MSNTFRIQSSKTNNLIEVVLANDHTNRKAYYVIKLYPDKRKLFYVAVKRNELDLDVYGDVLECGYGEEVPEAVRKKYNFL